jgi:hypothetical protein
MAEPMPCDGAVSETVTSKPHDTAEEAKQEAEDAAKKAAKTSCSENRTGCPAAKPCEFEFGPTGGVTSKTEPVEVADAQGQKSTKWRCVTTVTGRCKCAT